MPFTGDDPRTNLPYQPQVADLDDFDNPRHARLADQAWNAAQERPKFYESTVNEVFSRTPQRMWTDPEGRQRLYYKCAETGEWGPYDAFDIDHEIKWNDFLRAVQPATRADASIAYNDLSNLRAVISGANRAGDHNRDDIYSDDEENGDDGSDVGSDGNIRDLIEDEDAEAEMPAAARRGLDDYVRQQADPANRIRFDDIEAGRRRPREPDIEPPEDADDEDDEAGDLADDARSGSRRKRQRLRDEDEGGDDSGDEADDEASEGDDAAADASDADAAADAAAARAAQAARSASVAGDAAEAGEAADALGALEEIGELALVALL